MRRDDPMINECADYLRPRGRGVVEYSTPIGSGNVQAERDVDSVCDAFLIPYATVDNPVKYNHVAIQNETEPIRR